MKLGCGQKHEFIGKKNALQSTEFVSQMSNNYVYIDNVSMCLCPLEPASVAAHSTCFPMNIVQLLEKQRCLSARENTDSRGGVPDPLVVQAWASHLTLCGSVSLSVKQTIIIIFYPEGCYVGEMSLEWGLAHSKC